MPCCGSVCKNINGQKCPILLIVDGQIFCFGCVGKFSPFWGSQVFLWQCITHQHLWAPTLDTAVWTSGPRQYSFRNRESLKNLCAASNGHLVSKNYLDCVQRKMSILITHLGVRVSTLSLIFHSLSNLLPSRVKKEVIAKTFDNFKFFSKIPVAYIEVLKVLVLVLCGQRIKGPRPDFV